MSLIPIEQGPPGPPGAPGGSADLATVLALGNQTGPNNIVVDSSQKIDFAGGIDIEGTTDGSINFTATSRIDYASANTKISVVSDNISLDAGGGGLVEMTNAGVVGITSGAAQNVNITAGAAGYVSMSASSGGRVEVNSDLFLNGNDIQEVNVVKTAFIEPNSTISPDITINAIGSGNLNLSSANNILATADNLDISPTTIIMPSPIDPVGYAQIAQGRTLLRRKDTGGVANPVLTLDNQDTAAGSTSIVFNKNAFANGTTIGEMSFQAKTAIAGNPVREYARIGTTISNNITGNVDGTIRLSARVNDSLTELFRINGVDNQNECLAQLDMNGNAITSVSLFDIQNVSKIGLNGVANFGVAGQHIISRGSSAGALWMNPSQTLPLANYGGGATIDDTTPFIMGCSTNQPTFAPAGSGGTGRYKVDYSAVIEGVNQPLVIQSQLVYNGSTYGGEIFNSGDWYVSEPLTKSGSTHHSIAFSDYFTFPYVFGQTRTLQLEISVLTESGSGTTNDARITATITPCYS